MSELRARLCRALIRVIAQKRIADAWMIAHKWDCVMSRRRAWTVDEILAREG